jgi:hypothetical protein
MVGTIILIVKELGDNLKHTSIVWFFRRGWSKAGCEVLKTQSMRSPSRLCPQAKKKPVRNPSET